MPAIPKNLIYNVIMTEEWCMATFQKNIEGMTMEQNDRLLNGKRHGYENEGSWQPWLWKY